MATDRRNGVTAALAYKAPALLATTANITLSGLQAIDGITTVADDRVLVKNQSVASQNGLYSASSGTWQRCADGDGSGDWTLGSQVLVALGNTNAGLTYVQTCTDDPVVVGTSSIAFIEQSS